MTESEGPGKQPAIELIVLVDEKGNPIGEAEKWSSHHLQTPLHLAFSCYVFDGRGRLLVTRRAFGKKVWPGVWSNTVCGHPMPGERIEDAVAGRLHYELGMQATDITWRWRPTGTPLRRLEVSSRTSFAQSSWPGLPEIPTPIQSKSRRTAGSGGRSSYKWPNPPTPAVTRGVQDQVKQLRSSPVVQAFVPTTSA